MTTTGASTIEACISPGGARTFPGFVLVAARALRGELRLRRRMQSQRLCMVRASSRRRRRLRLH